MKELKNRTQRSFNQLWQFFSVAVLFIALIVQNSCNHTTTEENVNVIATHGESLFSPVPLVLRKEYQWLADATKTYNISFSIIIMPVEDIDEDAVLEINTLQMIFDGEYFHPIYLAGYQPEPEHHHIAKLYFAFPFGHSKITYHPEMGNAMLIAFKDMGMSQMKTHSAFDHFVIFNRQDARNNDKILKFQLQVIAHFYDASDPSGTVKMVPMFAMSFADMTTRAHKNITSFFESNGEEPRILPHYFPPNMIPLSFSFRCDSDRMLALTRDATVDDTIDICSFAEGNYFSSYSQNRQDLEIIEYTKGKKFGKFLDIGANDGMTHSNTYALEQYFAWSGLLIEPVRRLYPALFASRGNNPLNHILTSCVHNRTFNAEFIEVGFTGEFSGVAESWSWHHNNAYDLPSKRIFVPCFHIQSVLDAYELTHIDYLSIDAEGADIFILKAIDWTRFSADIVSVESHENDNLEEQLKFFFLSELGYSAVKKVQWDLMFFNYNLCPSMSLPAAYLHSRMDKNNGHAWLFIFIVATKIFLCRKYITVSTNNNLLYFHTALSA